MTTIYRPNTVTTWLAVECNQEDYLQGIFSCVDHLMKDTDDDEKVRKPFDCRLVQRDRRVMPSCEPAVQPVWTFKGLAKTKFPNWAFSKKFNI